MREMRIVRVAREGGGGATSRFWMPTTPPPPQLTVGRRPLGGGGGLGGGVLGGAMGVEGAGGGFAVGGRGVREGWLVVGGGGGNLGGYMPQGQALVHHRPLPLLALPLTIPSPEPLQRTGSAMPAILIRLNKIDQSWFMATFATSLLSVLDPNNNFHTSLGLELGLGLGLGSPSWWNQSWFYNPF